MGARIDRGLGNRDPTAGALPLTAMGTPTLSHEELVNRLSHVVETFAAGASAGDPQVGVPTCPGWSIGDLVVHLGDVHRWATRAIEDRVNGDRSFRPDPDESLAGWYRESAEGLLHALRTTPIDQDVWSFGPPPHRVTFWSRRQLHETMVHLWDLQSATGSADAIDESVARDGIDEVCSMFYPRQVRLGRMGELACTVAFDDGTGRWLLGPGDHPDVIVRGAAADLLLLVWKRVPLEHGSFEIEGSADAVQAVLAERITP